MLVSPSPLWAETKNWADVQVTPTRARGMEEVNCLKLDGLAEHVRD